MTRHGHPYGAPKSAGQARGVVRGGQRQVVIKMYEDQFNEVRARAVAENTSLAEQIRLLIKWGLESANV
jgi:hypothetical protein